MALTPVQWNFTIDDTSPLLSYTPYADGVGLTNGWQTWYTGSGFLTQTGESSTGDSYHLTSLHGASVTVSFFGYGVQLFGTTNSSYQVTFDDSIIVNATPDGSVLFSKFDAELGMHNVTLTATPTNESQQLGFDRVVVTSEANSTSPTPNTISIDSQNQSAIAYTGNWVPKNVATIPSAENPRPFMYTQDLGASAFLKFAGRSVAVYSSINWGHGMFGVNLDGEHNVYNASSFWLVPNALIYYADGLDPTRMHSLNITNLTGNQTRTLSTIEINQFPGNQLVSTGTTEKSGKKVNAGAIVGPIIAVLVLAIALFMFCMRRRRRQDPDMGAIDSEKSYSSFRSLLPGRGRKDNSVTPFLVRSPRSDTTSSSYFSPISPANGTSPAEDSSPKVIVYEKGRMSAQVPTINRPQNIQRKNPPPVVSGTWVPVVPYAGQRTFSGSSVSVRSLRREDSSDNRSAVSLPSPNVSSTAPPTNPASDERFIDRVLDLVVQRIDRPEVTAPTRQPASNVADDGERELPPYSHS